MSIQSHSEERTGILRVVDGIKSDEMARVIKADLEDLPGVHNVEVIGFAVRIHFDPALVTEQQFYQAIKVAGFQASAFQTAGP